VFLALDELRGMDCGEELSAKRAAGAGRQTSGVLRTPTTDIAELSERLGRAWGVSCGDSIAEYIAWSDAAGIFALLEAGDAVTADEAAASTVLNARGADALLGVLAGVGLVHRSSGGEYRATDLAREYLFPSSPYYAGVGLYLGCEKPVPAAFLRDGAAAPAVATVAGATPWPVAARLRIQHSRNFAPSVIAARSGHFDGLRHVLDIAGGSGVLAIPLALDHPEMRITLVESRPTADLTRTMLQEYGVDRQVSVIGMDIFEDSWQRLGGDGVFLGNVLHGYDDAECVWLCRQSFNCLSPGGRILVHEVVFDEDRQAPLLAALWHANMIARRAGAGQRTVRELMSLLQTAGFVDMRDVDDRND
jgi:predicted O-methyltransferase YrrM